MSELKRDKLRRRMESTSARHSVLLESGVSEEAHKALDKHLEAYWEYWNHPRKCDWQRFPEDGVSV